ncbi:RmlC-like cupin domain-containing protein [Flammula alnicola]|nr:RmlC-like cupin domain-containing protein [Flammula alnicola]
MSSSLSTSSLIKSLDLEEHPEGGYFVLTNVQNQKTFSTFAGRFTPPLATSIYYLLAYDRPFGIFHMNKSRLPQTYHVLHQGRAEYTLITPGNPPTIEQVVIGTNTAAGEKRLLVVGTGIWKRSSLLQEDIQKAKTDAEKDATNCLITEVVVPGFDWEDHRYMDMATLKELFEGVEGGEAKIDEFSKFLNAQAAK